jgi:hypothetical protein
MEGANVISFGLWTRETLETWKDFDKWTRFSRSPMLMSTGFRLGSEQGFPIEEKLISRRNINITYFKDLVSCLAHSATPEIDTSEKDFHIINCWRK